MSSPRAAKVEPKQVKNNKPLKFRDNKKSQTPNAPKRSWEDTYKDLVRYYNENGHCNVPFRHGQLGQWVSTQKRIKIKLTSDQIKKLNQIDFNWKKQSERQDDEWNEQFQKLKKYRKTNGDCLVIRKYEPDPTLGKWVSTQREFNKKGKLRADRKALLDQIGFTWVLKDPGIRSSRHLDLAFQDMYDRLVAFKEANGHCLVPTEYKRDTSLSSWVQNQRTKYKNDDLPRKRINMLEAVGFVWRVDPFNAKLSLSQRHWDDMFNELCRFHKEHGHSQVPVYNQPPGFHEKLGRWVRLQRKQYRNGDPQLTDHRRQKLESVNFWWGSQKQGSIHFMEPTLEKQWNDKFEELKRYKNTHGDFLVPTKSKEFNSLGPWVLGQRRLNRQNKLHGHRKEKLESLGFVWDANEERINHHWQIMYDKLRKFYDRHGHSDVPSTFKDQKLARWVCEQRMKEDDKEYMSTEREKMLDSLDFSWKAGKRKDDRDRSTSTSVENGEPCAKRRKREALVGKAVAVYWPDDDVYYRGMIAEKRERDGNVHVKYDDGDEEWLDPSKTEFEVLESPGDALPPRKFSPGLDKIGVGSRISVWWPQERQYCDATVLIVKPKSNRGNKYKLKYDDGEKEWTYLSARKFVLVNDDDDAVSDSD